MDTMTTTQHQGMTPGGARHRVVVACARPASWRSIAPAYLGRGTTGLALVAEHTPTNPADESFTTKRHTRPLGTRST